MRLDGIHHITAITADAPRNVDFYARVLGLRLVKKTVNFDAPDFYHLYFGDELGNPGSAITFFEFPGAAPGNAGAGMIHRVIWRVGPEDALDFWSGRLADEGSSPRREGSSLLFEDPEGLALELTAEASEDEPLAAAAAGVPPEHALLGFHGVRAYAADVHANRSMLVDTLGFGVSPGGEGYVLAGDTRKAAYHVDPAPDSAPSQGAGTVHHIAFTSADQEHAAWRDHIRKAGVHSTDIIDRQYFRSVYFREPSKVLFELATPSPGFTIDEPAARLGEALMLPSQYESLRSRLEQSLTPVANPRSALAGG
jgi:glyoxalase family protein